MIVAILHSLWCCLCSMKVKSKPRMRQTDPSCWKHSTLKAIRMSTILYHHANSRLLHVLCLSVSHEARNSLASQREWNGYPIDLSIVWLTDSRFNPIMLLTLDLWDLICNVLYRAADRASRAHIAIMDLGCSWPHQTLCIAYPRNTQRNIYVAAQPSVGYASFCCRYEH